ncbi:MAG TPA: spermine synthase, partial [bacterium (Candidatus Stahlbacteria)]|nr:spermine synthase [Candidatus Stahlbacteria bacterium]
MTTLIFAIILVGFTSVLTQTLLIRELVTVFYGNELTIGVMLAAWLAWGAVGSFVLGRFADRIKRRVASFAGIQLFIALMLPLQFLLVRSVRLILGVAPGELIGPLPMIYSCVLILAPFCVLSGFQFALGAKIYATVRKGSQ